jgi:hypothetical protein
MVMLSFLPRQCTFFQAEQGLDSQIRTYDFMNGLDNVFEMLHHLPLCSCHIAPGSEIEGLTVGADGILHCASHLRDSIDELLQRVSECDQEIHHDLIHVKLGDLRVKLGIQGGEGPSTRGVGGHER